jgi:site-specific DNA recombinase
MYLYYRCTSATIKGKMACPVRTVAADELEEFLIDKFKTLGENQKLLKKSITKTTTLAKQGLEPLRKDKKRVESQLAKVNQELKHLIEFVKSSDLDKKRARGIVKEISDLEGSKEKLEDEIHRIETNQRACST